LVLAKIKHILMEVVLTPCIDGNSWFLGILFAGIKYFYM